MAGLIMKVSLDDIDMAKLNWCFNFDEPVSNLRVDEFRYLVLCYQNTPRFVAKVDRVSVMTNSQNTPWVVQFSHILSVESLDMDLGGRSDCHVIMNSASEKKIIKLMAEGGAIDRPDKVPLHLTISEAAEALHQRYNIPIQNIKISLTN
jgi:hypothetical protein